MYSGQFATRNCPINKAIMNLMFSLGGLSLVDEIGKNLICISQFESDMALRRRGTSQDAFLYYRWFWYLSLERTVHRPSRLGIGIGLISSLTLRIGAEIGDTDRNADVQSDEDPIKQHHHHREEEEKAETHLGDWINEWMSEWKSEWMSD